MGFGVQAWGRVTGITVVVSALMLSVMGGGPASAAPEDETAWETGTASTIYDGDTLKVNITESNSGITGTQKVRTIGINAPELFTSPPQCGAQAATDALGTLLPKGTPVQLRSLNGTSYDTARARILRSLYAQDAEGNWFDTSRQLVSDGRVFWFPKPTWSVDKPEFAHNLEYRVLAGDASDTSRGLWTANSCGTAPNPGAQLRLAVSWESEVDGYEAIMIFNDGAAPVDIGGWIVRDSALNKHTLPAGMVVPANDSVELRLDAGTNGGGVYYTGVPADSEVPKGSWFDNLPAPNPEFVGDAVYLMDNAGPYSTGNIRAWYPYPCEPEDCVDPLKGKVDISGVTWEEDPTPPATPGDAAELRETITLVNTTGGPLGLGGYGLWDQNARPLNPGEIGPDLVDTPDFVFPRDARIPASGTLLIRSGEPTAIEPASANLLYTGKDRIFDADDRMELAGLNKAPVACRRTTGAACAVRVDKAVPTQPLGVSARARPREASVDVSWGLPLSSGGTPITGYTATAFTVSLGGSPVSSCSTNGSARACSLPAQPGTPHYIEVVAHNAVGTSAPSAPRQLATPRTVPSAPGSVQAASFPGAAHVTWEASAANGSAITSYTAAAYTAPTGGESVASCTTAGDGRGCTMTGLSQSRAHYVEVTATNGLGTGAPSSPRMEAGAQGGPSALSTYSKRRVTVRWDDPGASAAWITGYSAKVYKKAKGGKKIGACTAGPDKTKCRTGKLKKRKKYYIKLTTNTSLGRFTLAKRIKTGPPRKASAPKIATATRTDRTALVGWTPPKFTGYLPLKRYNVRIYKTAKSKKVQAKCYRAASKDTCTMKVPKKRKYYSAVRVKNAKGWSKWSKRVKLAVG